MKKFILFTFIFFLSLGRGEAFSQIEKAEDGSSVERILNTNLYLKKDKEGDIPKLLFGYEIKDEDVKLKKRDGFIYDEQGFITVYDFHPKILFGDASSYIKVQFDKNNDIEIKYGENKFIIKNNGRFEPKSGDLSILSQYKENGTQYYILHFSGNGSQTNAHYAWIEHSIHLVTINEQNTEISGGYDYTSPAALTDGNMSIIKDKDHILITEGSSIMYFNTHHPEWGIMIKKIDRQIPLK